MYSIFVFIFAFFSINASATQLDNYVEILRLARPTDSSFSEPGPDLNSFQEIIRRIPSEKRLILLEKLTQTTLNDVLRIRSVLKHPEFLFVTTNSPLQIPEFPILALKAAQMGAITHLQFGTLMILHTLKNEPYPPQFIPLFSPDGQPNSQATSYLAHSTSHYGTISTTEYPLSLDKASIQELYKRIESMPKALLNEEMPPGELGFWEIHRPKPTLLDTVADRLLEIGFNVFFRLNVEDLHFYHEIIPSFGLFQVYLNSTFPTQSVRLNPVIGISSPRDIRAGAWHGHRDIAVPFPDFPLPLHADGIPVSNPLEFMQHDFYHAIRQSGISVMERRILVKIGDKLETIQRSYQDLISARRKNPRIESRKTNHNLSLLDTFRTMPFIDADTLRDLEKYRIALGRLKFEIWDLEKPLDFKHVSNALSSILENQESLALDSEEIEFLQFKIAEATSIGLPF